jgi:hypothetical protein
VAGGADGAGADGALPAGVAEGVTTSSPSTYAKDSPFPVGGLECGIVPQRTLGAIRMPFASSSSERLT